MGQRDGSRPRQSLCDQPSFRQSEQLAFRASPNDGFFVRTTWDGSARLRFGWLVTPLYLTGGLAWAHLEAMSDCSTVTTPNVSNCAAGNYFGGTLAPAVISHSATKLGWTLGTGIDVALTPQWVVRGQYRMSDFGYLNGAGAFNFTDVRTCTGCAAGTNPLTVAYQLLMVQHNFEIGLAYKFDHGADKRATSQFGWREAKSGSPQPHRYPPALRFMRATHWPPGRSPASIHLQPIGLERAFPAHDLVGDELAIP